MLRLLRVAPISSPLVGLSLLACQSGAVKAPEPALNAQDTAADATPDTAPTTAPRGSANSSANPTASSPCRLHEEYLDEQLGFSLQVGGPTFATLYGGVSEGEHRAQLKECMEHEDAKEKGTGKHYCATSIIGAQVEVTIPDDYPQAAASLSAHRSGITLRGKVGPQRLLLHAGPARILGGFLATDERFHLQSRTGVTFHAQLPLPSLFSEPRAITRDVRCSELSINRGERNAASQLDHLAPATDERLKLVEGQLISLRQSPGGVQVALLDPEQGGIDMLHARRRESGFALVTFDVGQGTALGWVDDAQLEEDASEFGHGGLGLSGWGQGGGGGARPLLECSQRLSLWGQQGGEQKQVGEVEPNVAIRLYSQNGDFTQVAFPDQSWFQTYSTSSLLLRTSDLTACTPLER